MKRSILGAAVLTLGLALGAGLTGEAKAFTGATLAIDGGRAATGALYQQVDHKKHWKHKKHKKHWHKKHHHNHHGGPSFVFTLGGLLAGPQVFAPAQGNCHPVANDGYVQGRYAKIGSTLCYDQLGRGYVVPGSEHVIHFY